MTQQPIMLAKREYDILKMQHRGTGHTDHNRTQLERELATARVITDGTLPQDVVCINSEIEFCETGSGQKFTLQIVQPSEANITKKKISVLSLLSIALLGYRTGAKVVWEMPNGVKTFEILQVKPL